jgi:purine-nucleoside phosphorylase
MNVPAALREIAGGEIDVVILTGTSGSLLEESFTATPLGELASTPPAAVFRWGAKRLVVFRGFLHGFQTQDTAEITRPVSHACEAGAKVIIMIAVASGLHRAYVPGDVVLVRDHLDFSGQRLMLGMGHGHGQWVTTATYAPRPRERLVEASRAARLRLLEGVIGVVSGPQFETRAEAHRMARSGAHLVTMAPIPLLVSRASYFGVDVVALALVSNSYSVAVEALSHESVLLSAKRMRTMLGRYLEVIIDAVG